VMARARAAAALAGGSLRETEDREEALAGAHVLYAKSWTSPRPYGDPPAEAAFRAGLRDWCVDDEWFSNAAPDCRFMHCLPVRRNVVVKDSVLDGPRSVVVHEARNRMWAQMAVLHHLLGEKR
jgi:N-acetylornithine carbamoyltransferase